MLWSNVMSVCVWIITLATPWMGLVIRLITIPWKSRGIFSYALIHFRSKLTKPGNVSGFFCSWHEKRKYSVWCGSAVTWGGRSCGAVVGNLVVYISSNERLYYSDESWLIYVEAGPIRCFLEDIADVRDIAGSYRNCMTRVYMPCFMSWFSEYFGKSDDVRWQWIGNGCIQASNCVPRSGQSFWDLSSYL